MQTNQKVLGLTGGIGSGKSTVGRIFSGFGYPVFDSDKAAKAIYQTDSELKAQVIEAFGSEIFEDGELQRERLAKLVFGDKTKLAQLNKMVHPAVGRAFDEWRTAQNTEWVLKEAAILVESGAYKQCQKIVTIQAPEGVRLARVSARDGNSETEIRKRISNQMTDEERAKFADFSIENHSEHSLISQVAAVIALL